MQQNCDGKKGGNRQDKMPRESIPKSLWSYTTMKPQQFIKNICKQYRPMKYLPIFNPKSTISVDSLI